MAYNFAFLGSAVAVLLLSACSERALASGRGERDTQTRDSLLLQSGGLPGQVPVKIVRPKNPKPTNASFWRDYSTDAGPCEDFAYEYTHILPYGAVRHEHAVIRYQGTENEVLDIAGYYLHQGGGNSSNQWNSDRPFNSFALSYWKQGGNETYHSLEVACKTEEWGVLYCHDCLKKDYVVHGYQEPSCRETGPPSPTSLGSTTLEAALGLEGLRLFEVPKSFNASLLLEHFGGAPGNYSPASHKDFMDFEDFIKSEYIEYVPPEEPAEDPNQRPLPDAPKESWLYNHWQYFLPWAIRVEHGIARFAGKPNQFLDVRGVLYWRSSVGFFRVEYTQDDTGFHAKVEAASCDITRGLWKCTYPRMPEEHHSCGAAIPGGLLAALVGAGK